MVGAHNDVRSPSSFSALYARAAVMPEHMYPACGTMAPRILRESPVRSGSPGPSLWVKHQEIISSKSSGSSG